MTFLGDDCFLDFYSVEQAERFQQFGGLKEAREDRPISDGIAYPSLNDGVRKIDIIPILQRQIGRLKNEPDEDRPGDHQEEFFGPARDEGIPFQAVDDPIDRKDIRPPGKTVKPRIERLDFFEKEILGDEKKKNADDSMDRKSLFHRAKLSHFIFLNNQRIIGVVECWSNGQWEKG
jgi:hypothetical protein